jgi:hypothetical protein
VDVKQLFKLGSIQPIKGWGYFVFLSNVWRGREVDHLEFGPRVSLSFDWHPPLQRRR